MKTRTNFVALDDIKLFYDVYGSGNVSVLCLHGNSRSPEDFKFLANEQRKIISIHLFLHGKSTFSKERFHRNFIQVEHVEKLLEKILNKEKVNHFHWVAYSQGGLFTLTAFPALAERVESLSLLAPDGLNDSSFYAWSQRRWWARKLFKRWTKRPQELMSISKVLAKLRIIHPKILEFLDFYTSEPERLKMAFKSWSSFRKLRPDESAIRKAFQKYSIPFQLIIGKYDKIISPDSAKSFLKSINQTEALNILPHGHDLFKPETQPKIEALLEFEEIQSHKKKNEKY